MWVFVSGAFAALPTAFVVPVAFVVPAGGVCDAMLKLTPDKSNLNVVPFVCVV